MQHTEGRRHGHIPRRHSEDIAIPICGHSDGITIRILYLETHKLIAHLGSGSQGHPVILLRLPYAALNRSMGCANSHRIGLSYIRSVIGIRSVRILLVLCSLSALRVLLFKASLNDHIASRHHKMIVGGYAHSGALLAAVVQIHSQALQFIPSVRLHRERNSRSNLNSVRCSNGAMRCLHDNNRITFHRGKCDQMVMTIRPPYSCSLILGKIRLLSQKSIRHSHNVRFHAIHMKVRAVHLYGGAALLIVGNKTAVQTKAHFTATLNLNDSLMPVGHNPSIRDHKLTGGHRDECITRRTFQRLDNACRPEGPFTEQALRQYDTPRSCILQGAVIHDLPIGSQCIGAVNHYQPAIGEYIPEL